ncbi:DUF4190 domain-containing protein [Streptomyces sp. NPDC047081]|uniref:DUF4190 domain-containing protein n=1 Tax=Streptomyces sp. NPDC047081 TaxID=3154706 RepID=UPI0033C5600A
MAEQTQPGEQDPWAPPERKTSLDKGAQPASQDQQPYSQAQSPASQQPAGQPPSMHDQATVTSVPSDGFAPPTPGYGYPGAAAPGHGTPPYGAPGPQGGGPQGGWAESAVPPPPMAPGGPAPQGPPPPGGYGYPAYPQGYGWPGMQPPPQNGMGTSAMVLGIVSCCLFCFYGVFGLVLGILAVIFGIKGKRRADRGEATNRGQAQAGFITGIIGIILSLAMIALVIVGIVLAINDNDDSSDYDPYYNSAPSVSAPLLAES